MNTKATYEILAKSRLEILYVLIKEYKLFMDRKLVRSDQNKANSLTRVPQRKAKPIPQT